MFESAIEKKHKSEILIKDFMTPNPICLKPDDTIKEATRIFYQGKFDGAPVVNNDGELLGIFTKNHLYRAIVKDVPLSTPIKKFMNKTVITIKETDSPEYGWQLGWTMGVGRLPVVNNKKKLTGIWTRTNLVRAFERKALEIISQLNNVLKCAHNGIVAINKEGIITVFNEAAAKITNIPIEQSIGKPIQDIFETTKLIEILETGKSSYSQKQKFNNINLLANRSPIIVEGLVVGAMAVFQDLSEIEAISAELEIVSKLNKELDAIIESSYDGIAIADGNGNYLKVNKALKKITGLETEDFIGKNAQSLIDGNIINKSAALEVIKTNRVVTVKQIIITGKELLVSGSPIFDDSGNIQNIILNYRDFSKLNELQQKLEETTLLTHKYYSEIKALRSQQLQHENIVAHSSSMKKVIELSNKVANVNCNVLLLGETGVGKDILAKLLHKNNNLRANGPFIKVNCGAIPENLLESELFGYADGAFTGSKKGGKPGSFELADGGTLFLDEIGDLPFNLQSKLLNVLQDKEIKRIGDTVTKKIDVRIIAATNQNLKKEIEEGTFRRDLYYRLDVVNIHIPPLRERSEDILPLLMHFLKKYNKIYSEEKKLTGEAIEIFSNYSWPGNIRELENIVERIIVTLDSEYIDVTAIPHYLYSSQDNLGNKNHLNKEKEILGNLYDQYQSTREVAKVLGVHQSTVVRKMKKHNIEPAKGHLSCNKMTV